MLIKSEGTTNIGSWSLITLEGNNEEDEDRKMSVNHYYLYRWEEDVGRPPRDALGRGSDEYPPPSFFQAVESTRLEEDLWQPEWKADQAELQSLAKDRMVGNVRIPPVELQLWTMDPDWVGQKGKHWQGGWRAVWQKEFGEGRGVDVMKNQKHCKESKLEGGELRSLWNTEIYILVGVGFLAIPMSVGGWRGGWGHGESERKRSFEVWLVGGSSHRCCPWQLKELGWRGKSLYNCQSLQWRRGEVRRQAIKVMSSSKEWYGWVSLASKEEGFYFHKDQSNGLEAARRMSSKPETPWDAKCRRKTQPPVKDALSILSGPAALQGKWCPQLGPVQQWLPQILEMHNKIMQNKRAHDQIYLRYTAWYILQENYVTNEKIQEVLWSRNVFYPNVFIFS